MQDKQRFGNYDLVRRIDVGGMGEVYLAHQRTAFGRPVAIKIIRSDLVHDLTARARFLREAEVSAHLKHEHILPLFEFGEDQGRLFLVTPYIEGGTLAKRLQSGPLSLEEAHSLFLPLVQAVAYIHRRSVIHRDLKPTNILLDEEDGQVYVRLIDFGIATLQGQVASPQLTTAGSEVGTIAYMAPERLNGISAPSNDIFSLGVILYQMLTGELPMGDQLAPLPPPIEYVIRHCIAPRPEDRFATADEVYKNFERAYQVVITRQAAQQFVPANASPAQTAKLPEEELPQVQVSLADTGNISVLPQPAPHSSFSRDDYGAPTTSFEPGKYGPSPTRGSRPPVPPKPRRKKSLMPLLYASIAVILLSIIAVAYYGYQMAVVSAISVSVNIGPRVQTINEVLTLTGDPTRQSSNLATHTIPVRNVQINRSDSASGPATGQTNCVLFFCQKVVSQDDVDNLATQIKPGLDASISQDLLSRVKALGGTAIGGPIIQENSPQADPPVGSRADNVTVTLTENGSIAYYLPSDAKTLARQVLSQQAQALGKNYVLQPATEVIGEPAAQSISPDSKTVIIKIAVGVVVVYQFTQDDLQAIKNGLKGKSVADARNFLLQQPDIDPQSVKILFTSGNSDTMPDNINQIHLIPMNPTSLPTLQLTAVPTPTFTPSPGSGNGPTPSPSPSPTSTSGDGNGN